MNFAEERVARCPANWERKRIKHHISKFFGGGTPSKDNAAFWSNGTIPWVSSKDMKVARLTTTEDYITEAALAGSSTNMVKPGSILMVVRSGILKHSIPVAINDVPVTLNQDLKAMELRKSLDTQFFQYWVTGQQKDLLLEWGQLGATVDSIDVDAMRNTIIPLPNLETQKFIADFLDHESARIDALVEKRNRFNGLLDEVSRSLIADAISGKLITSKARKDADWLGTVPESWNMNRMRFLFRERIGRSENGDEELLSVSHLTGVTKRSEKDVNMFLAESNVGYKLVMPGDLVINTMWAWMGAMGISSEEGIISPSYGVYCPVSGELLPEFSDLVVRSPQFVAEATRRSKGIHSSRLRLYTDALYDISFPVPPLDEQRQMIEQLDRRRVRERALRAKNERAISLLQELRSALITAAVTGQIDPATYRRKGSTDRTLDRIEKELST